jgi:hypothetical protein
MQGEDLTRAELRAESDNKSKENPLLGDLRPGDWEQFKNVISSAPVRSNEAALMLAGYYVDSTSNQPPAPGCYNEERSFWGVNHWQCPGDNPRGSAGLGIHGRIMLRGMMGW